MGKHSDSGGHTVSKQDPSYQPEHGKADDAPKSNTDASRVVGRLKSERAAGK